MPQQVRIDPSFFRKERDQTYSDWKLSFWRELFQNAIDQNADAIRIGMKQVNLNQVEVTFHDDGPGMTREVLDNVYFAVGATTKSGPNQIGGMGRARILTCFSMPSYRIRSHKYEVVGQRGEYDVLATPDHANGCLLTILVEISTVEEMTAKLTQFMRESRIPARVYLNGERMNVHSDLPGRHIRDLTVDGVVFARAYVNKSSHNHRVIIRVSGVSMFTEYTNAKAQIIIELEPSISRDVLTSNRDGLRGQYDSVLHAFQAEIAINTNSALRPRYQHRILKHDGGGFKTAHRRVETKASKSNNFGSVDIQPAALYDSKAIAENSAVAPERWDDTYDETLSERSDFGTWLRDTFGDIFIFDESAEPTIHKVVPNFLPENWRQTWMPDGSSVRKGSRIAKILLMWKTAIDYALEIGMVPMDLSTVAYGVGFVFSNDERLAECRGTNGGHVFALSPVGKDGKLRYSVRDKRSQKRLMTFAKHEITHIAVEYHNETFSSMREQIDMMFDDAECFRRMKTALDNVPDFGDD